MYGSKTHLEYSSASKEFNRWSRSGPGRFRKPGHHDPSRRPRESSGAELPQKKGSWCQAERPPVGSLVWDEGAG